MKMDAIYNWDVNSNLHFYYSAKKKLNTKQLFELNKCFLRYINFWKNVFWNKVFGEFLQINFPMEFDCIVYKKLFEK